MGKRGQITIPQKARNIFHYKPKSDLHIVGDMEKGLGIGKLDKHKQSKHSHKISGEGKFYFGTARMSERGQIVIPQQARDKFDLNPGDLLLIFGDIEKGLGLIKSTKLKNFASKLFQAFGFMNSDEKMNKEEDKNDQG
ncbi:MAG: AbrB/MazE/SpoVT family DNA-binding domain-containing protein [Promethearchaeia archaeon]